MDLDFVLKTREIVKSAFLARASECQAGSQLSPRGQTLQNLLVLTAENRENVRISSVTRKPNAPSGGSQKHSGRARRKQRDVMMEPCDLAVSSSNQARNYR